MRQVCTHALCRRLQDADACASLPHRREQPRSYILETFSPNILTVEDIRRGYINLCRCIFPFYGEVNGAPSASGDLGGHIVPGGHRNAVHGRHQIPLQKPMFSRCPRRHISDGRAGAHRSPETKKIPEEDQHRQNNIEEGAGGHDQHLLIEFFMGERTRESGRDRFRSRSPPPPF